MQLQILRKVFFIFVLSIYIYILIFFRQTLDKKYSYCVRTVRSKKQVRRKDNGEVAKLILEKCNHVFSKNNKWIELQKIKSIHNGTALKIYVEQYNLNDLIYMKYAPITSVDVGRSFSMYKITLASNRMSFNESNLTKYMVINSFFNI
uniref:Uncharacterized protein n=1 Tax=Schizaphis graminum TaxID=13262 RepID=A0A2S2PPA4_SCHGA